MRGKACSQGLTKGRLGAVRQETGSPTHSRDLPGPPARCPLSRELEMQSQQADIGAAELGSRALNKKYTIKCTMANHVGL